MGTITFRTEDGIDLEAELRLPDAAPRATVAVCHPHPRHGGSKDHPLLWTVRNELAGKRGFAVLGFNFRGVMGSGGEHTGGAEEPKDARAALARVRRESDGPSFLVGWSFGANVALRHAVTDDRLAGLVLIGVPLGDVPVSTEPLPDDEILRSFTAPTLLVAGDDDPFCPVPLLLELAGRIPNADVRVLEGTGHFFPRRERESATAIGEFLEGVLQEG